MVKNIIVRLSVAIYTAITQITTHQRISSINKTFSQNEIYSL